MLLAAGQCSEIALIQYRTAVHLGITGVSALVPVRISISCFRVTFRIFCFGASHRSHKRRQIAHPHQKRVGPPPAQVPEAALSCPPS
jgi:hypothetical protein